MQYKDVADQVTVAPALTVDADIALSTVNVAAVAKKEYQWPRCLHQVLRPHLPQVLVLRRADGQHPYTTPCHRYYVGTKWQ